MTGGDPVSRETPPVPALARGVFAERCDLAASYAELLATDGVTRGLIGPREAPRLWERHLLNCAVLTDELPDGTDVADLGSGAGLPGVVLAIRRPDLRVTLVEPLLRRCTFLTEVVDRLGLSDVEVVRARAEDLHGSREFSVVTSRAVAPLPLLLAWSLPMVRPGGVMVAMKGASAREEMADAAGALRDWGVLSTEVRELGIDLINPPTTVIRVQVGDPAGLRWGARQQRRGGRSSGPHQDGKGRRR